MKLDDKRMFDLAYLQSLHKQRFGIKPKVDVETKYERLFEENERTKELIKKWKPVLDEVAKLLPDHETDGKPLQDEGNR